MNIKDYNFQGKKAFVRVDFNVPLENGKITDDTRIRGALPTLKKILNDGGRLIIASHLGRPEKNPDERFSLRQILDAVSQHLGIEVKFAADCGNAQKEVEALKNGDTVTIFPEGTSTEGREILPFKPSFFQTAYDAGVPIIPALCRYPNPDGSSPNPHTAYYGDISLWQSICMVISQPSSTVELHFLDPIEAGEDRYATALHVHTLLSEKQKQLG